MLLAKGNKQKILEILTHNLVHLYQYEFSTPPRKGYHDREWADKMESIGLIPSTTSESGGKRVGDSMAQYPQPGGLFDLICKAFPDDFILPFRCSGDSADATAKAKAVYVCSFCKAKTWGKPGLEIMCLCAGANRTLAEETLAVMRASHKMSELPVTGQKQSLGKEGFVNHTIHKLDGIQVA
jgi:hypothetical protein